MKEKQDYIQEISDIRSMMERSSKFLSLSGWAGIMAGVYALAGVFIASKYFNFNPDKILYTVEPGILSGLITVAIIILVLAVSTAIFLSYRKAGKKGESGWNSASKRLMMNMAVPLITAGIFILVLISKGLLGLIAPITLLFYGLAFFTAGRFTYDEVKFMGIIQIILGLISSIFVEYSLILWAMGFGLVNILYGIYMYSRYER